MDKYQKVRVLGKGSFGSAILIKRKVDNALFVVKEVSFLKMSKKERDEARHECTILQKLKHPNIVRYVEQFENQRSLYIVMEYCDGGDLNAKIQQSRGPMKESTIMYYFSQVCLAMEYLHSFHMLHRDIKTMNVFLMKNGAVKLGDFGITTILRNTMGMANTVCGTPYYFSPELCRNKPYNNKSDIWALGVLLYECATGGRHPFDGANMNQLMQRIVTGQCAAISSQYSPEFRKMIAWCLQKDPIRRPSIKQLLSLPLVRRSLEQLEENLMLATECRVRLKDIIDFNAGSPNSENSNECQAVKKSPCTSPRAEPKKVKQAPGLTPGQAAAMAMVRQSPPQSSPESKRVADVLGPKPKAPNVNHNQNNANHATPGELYQRNMLDKLQQMRNRLNAGALAGPSPYAKRPSSPCNRKILPPDSEPPVKSEEIAATPDSPPFCEYQPNVQRIKAIMAKYEHNANPQAKETIHAYMRRKQEDYLKKQKEDLERRKRLNELREKELQRILVQQRRAALGVENNANANGYNANNKPIKEAQSPAPLPREAGVSPRNNRVPTAASPSHPSIPLYKDNRCAPVPHSPTRPAGLPFHAPAQGLQRMFGVDPRYAPCSPVKGLPKANTPPLMGYQHKVKVAANSPLHADKAAYQKVKQAVCKRKDERSLGDPPKGIPKKRYSNGYPLDRLDHKAREVVSREAEERKNPQQRSSFATNAEALKKNKNLVDKVAAPQGASDDAMVITGSQVAQFRAPQSRQGRPPRPAILNALLDNANGAEHAAPKLTPPSTPISKPNAEKRVRSSLNLECQPHVATPLAGLRNRIPSSPALTPRSLASLPPAVPHSAAQTPDKNSEYLFKRITPSVQNPKSYEVQAPNLPLSPSKQNPLVSANRQSPNQQASNSDAVLTKPVENRTNLQDCKSNAILPLSTDTSPLELSSLVIKGNEDSVSEAELIDVAHTVKGCTPMQATPLMINKENNLSTSDSKSKNPAIQRKKSSMEDVKPIYHPAPDARPHHLCWPLSSEAARYAGMLKGPDIHTAEVELHPLKDVSGEVNEREVVMPSMLETLRTLRSKVSPYRDCNSADNFSKQLALLKRRQRLGVERHHVIRNTEVMDINSQSNEGDPETIPEKPSSAYDTPRKRSVLDSEDVFPSRCTSAEKETRVSSLSDHDSVSDTKRTSLVEGYEEMLQHLRSLLEKRRVSCRNIRKLYKNDEDSISRPLSPANIPREDLDNRMFRNEIVCPSDLVSVSPPRLLNTKSGNKAQAPVLVPMDELSESSGIDQETDDVNGDDDNFEDAIPLSPVRCAVRNDMYTQMLQQNLIRGSEVDVKGSNVSDILHSNVAPHDQDAILRRDCTRC